MEIYRIEGGVALYAFVIMPTHLHLILFDHDFNNERLQRTIRDMRQYSGRQLSDYCQHSMPASFGQAIRGTK